MLHWYFTINVWLVGWLLTNGKSGKVTWYITTVVTSLIWWMFWPFCRQCMAGWLACEAWWHVLMLLYLVNVNRSIMPSMCVLWMVGWPVRRNSDMLWHRVATATQAEAFNMSSLDPLVCQPICQYKKNLFVRENNFSWETNLSWVQFFSLSGEQAGHSCWKFAR